MGRAAALGAISRDAPRHEKKSSTWAASWLALIELWAARRRQRRALAVLAEDDHLLDDIGASREAALCEAAKPFWRQ